MEWIINGVNYAGIFFWGFLEVWIVVSFGTNILGIKENRKKWLVPSTIVTMFLVLCIPRKMEFLSLGVFVAAGYLLCRGGKAQRICMMLHGTFLIFYTSYLRMFMVYSINKGFGDIFVYYWFCVLLAFGFRTYITACVEEAYGEEDHSKDGWIYAGVSLVNFFILWIFDGMIRDGYDLEILKLMMIVITVFMAADYILLIQYQRNISKVKTIRMLGEFQKKSELEQEHLKRLEEVYGEFKGMAHDMNRYLTVLTSLSDHADQNADQAELTDEIKARISHVGQEFYCMRPVLNALLNEKEKKAKEHGIQMEIFAEAGFDFDGLDDYSLIGIVSNLIDNALEAAEQCEEKKWVSVRLFAVNDGKQKFMRVENTQIFVEAVREKRFFTTKPDKKDHGYGLRNVQKLVEENQGKLRLKSEGDRFRAEVMFG